MWNSAKHLIFKAACARLLCGHAEYKSPTHPQRCLLVYLEEPTRKKGPCLINIPKAQSQLLSGSPLPSWFLLQPWAVSDSVLSSSLLQLSSVTKHPASHPLTLFPSKLGESECKAEVGLGGGWRGRWGGRQGYFCSWHKHGWEPTPVLCLCSLILCLPQSDWPSPLPCPPPSSPSKSVLCLLALSQSCYSG